ncbi:hypothetical protein [Rhodopila sp.]|uniref:hypothetical protein n=1 Tax=Rhodopila sp. TaxID=2480087 RepID=UPI003D1327D9
MIDSIPRFLNGAYHFIGNGYDKPNLLDPRLVYTVPFDKRAQLIYVRLGNSTSEMIYLSLMHDGKPIRLFPVGAKSASHVPLAVVEDLPPDSRIELFLAAPSGCSGSAVVDLGLVEI